MILFGLCFPYPAGCPSMPLDSLLHLGLFVSKKSSSILPSPTWLSLKPYCAIFLFSPLCSYLSISQREKRELYFSQCSCYDITDYFATPQVFPFVSQKPVWRVRRSLTDCFLLLPVPWNNPPSPQRQRWHLWLTREKLWEEKGRSKRTDINISACTVTHAHGHKETKTRGFRWLSFNISHKKRCQIISRKYMGCLKFCWKINWGCLALSQGLVEQSLCLHYRLPETPHC